MKLAEPAAFVVSFTVTVTLKVPAVVGVPEIMPEVLSFRSWWPAPPVPS